MTFKRDISDLSPGTREEQAFCLACELKAPGISTFGSGERNHRSLPFSAPTGIIDVPHTLATAHELLYITLTSLHFNLYFNGNLQHSVYRAVRIYRNYLGAANLLASPYGNVCHDSWLAGDAVDYLRKAAFEVRECHASQNHITFRNGRLALGLALIMDLFHAGN